MVLGKEAKLTGARRCSVGSPLRLKGGVSSLVNDFIRSDGQDRISLLHCTPGVWKTTTAEAVAEFMYRPLIDLTSGDLLVNLCNG